MKVIAVIPARGGSKRIPHKNIIDFMGKPMIAWTIEAAIKSNIFHRIILSTDSEKIADVGRSYGIEVPFLRQKNSDDYTPVSMATKNALEQSEEYFAEDYDVVVQLMANTPLRDETDIIDHYNNFVSNNFDFQISSFKFGWMNPWWAFKLIDENQHDWMFSENLQKRSQDLEDLFCPTGAVWIAKVKQLKIHNTFYGPNFKFYELDFKSAVDIDNYNDLEFAKSMFLVKNNTINL